MKYFSLMVQSYSLVSGQDVKSTLKSWRAAELVDPDELVEVIHDPIFADLIGDSRGVCRWLQD